MFILLVSLMSSSLMATSLSCGDYLFKGSVRFKNHKMSLVISQDQGKELLLVPTPLQELELTPYLNKKVFGRLKVLKHNENRSAYDSFSIVDISKVAPGSDLENQESFLVKAREVECKDED